MRSHRIVALGLVVSLAALPRRRGEVLRLQRDHIDDFTGLYLAPAGTTKWGANET